MFGPVVLTWLFAEIVLRMVAPDLGSDLFVPSTQDEIPLFTFNDRVGYEFTPNAVWLQPLPFDGAPTLVEKLNSDGFRGPDRQIPKPSGTFRILALGDSVVEPLCISYPDSWEAALERELNGRAKTLRYELIDGGIAGYVSWQALRRLEDRGYKYEPDLVLVLVGWNDLMCSSLPNWFPKIDQTKIQQGWTRPQENPSGGGFLDNLRLTILRYSYVARLIRQARSNVQSDRISSEQDERQQIDAPIEFNERALQVYLENLELLYRSTRTRNIPLGLITWPTVQTPDSPQDPRAADRPRRRHRRFPLSPRQQWDWYVRYQEAQREFARGHPDILLIDAAHAFERYTQEERLKWFLDVRHLSVEGNLTLAQILLRVFEERGMCR